MLLAVALASVLGVAALLRLLAATPSLDIAASADEQGRVRLGASTQPALQPLAGQVLLAVGTPGLAPTPVDAALLHRSPRWQPDEDRRAASLAQNAALAAALRSGEVALRLADGRTHIVPASPRGLAGLGATVWPLCLAALLLPLFGAMLLRERPGQATALLLALCVAQALGLGLLAATSLRGLGLHTGLLAAELPLRLAIDLAAVAAPLHAFALARRPALAAALWAGVGLSAAAVALGLLQPAWAWAQALCVLAALAALVAAWRPRANAPDPRRAVIGRLALTALLTWLAANAAVLATTGHPALAQATAAGATVAWALFGVALLLLVPFVVHGPRLLRELALLAGIGTVAAALNLLLVAVFALDATASVAVVVFLALAAYAFARQRLLDKLLGARLQGTDRIFELLYRAARDAQRRPDRQMQRLGQLLRELFDPLEMSRDPALPRQAEVQDGGLALLVPLRAEGEEGRPGLAVRLRLAGRGQRLFMPEDARLADRVVEQLKRAVAYDRAVERGRTEERQRLAQDLHDDIGARLLTLMYQAPTPELEDYIRHTLQDLKTLTRGLAVAEHRLGAAAAEWKRDLAQRLAAAQAQLGWACEVDEALVLSVGQWSALTRVLRELVTNALFHGRASRVDVALELRGQALVITVADDGAGRNPDAWAHGLGLGGVRKRVKQLGGRVAWQENGERGIVCRVHIEGFRDAAGTPPPG